MRHLSAMIMCIVLLLPFSVWGRRRDAHDALSVATRHWQRRDVVSRQKRLVSYMPVANELTTVVSELDGDFFVARRCNATGSTVPGFVLVARDPHLPAVLAYSDDAIFPDNVAVPPHVQAMLDDYAAMSSSSETNTFGTGNPVEEVLPLLGVTAWGQDSPYNMLCPMSGNAQCPTGCVATALAQVMRCHRHPAVGIGSVDYVSDTKSFPLSCDFAAMPFLWDEMRDTYGLMLQDGDMAVATLMYAVGLAVHMDYTATGSGADSEYAIKAMQRYFGYDADAYVAKAADFEATTWHRFLQNELHAGRPLYYAGGQHAFVIDGVQDYEGMTYYSVNWGWDGVYNGYFLINKLTPEGAGTGGSAGSNYARDAETYIGFMPDDGIDQPLQMYCRDLRLRDDVVRPGGVISTRITRLVVLDGDDFNGRLSLSLCSLDDADAQPLELYVEPQRTVRSDRGFIDYYILTRLPDDLAPGRYELRLQCQNTDGDEVNILCDGWPMLHVPEPKSWSVGPDIATQQYVALRGLHASASHNGSNMVTLRADSIINLLDTSIGGMMSALVCDETGKLLYSIGDAFDMSLSSNGMRRNLRMDVDLSSLPDGDYLLTLGFRPDTWMQWTLCYRMIYEDHIWWSSYERFYWRLRVRAGTLYIYDDVVNSVTDIPMTTAPTRDAFHDVSGRPLPSPQRRGLFIHQGRVWHNAK